MAGELESHDPAQLRISDADRHQVAEILREAAGEGRLELDEVPGAKHEQHFAIRYSGPSGLVEEQLDENSPLVRVRGVAIWGGVNVERKHARNR